MSAVKVVQRSSLQTLQAGSLCYNKRVLLHTCCVNCAAASIERLQELSYEVGVYFCNSNIYPIDEFEKRCVDMQKYAEKINVPVWTEDYDHQDWLNFVKGFEDEPEKGERCRLCFRYNLARTAKLAETENYDLFTTTLTISPHKISKIIFEEGKMYPAFLDIDFKKQDGFKRSLVLSEINDFYRQKYCGCEFSKRQT
ncbi:MAG: epoxyqueuosine reductase QueH [Kiritimatiellae bacterium]|jgi:predicted adenine nucleotide alpha hydrolase (AANH) superfamily ATPase|nr:epoxyqueuosine reductase QueH [Kiritimatiellia bacterium]